MKDTLIHSAKHFHDNFLFAIVVLAGIFTKIWLAIQKGKKPSLSWLLAEAIVSLFIAFSVYAVCDQYFSLNKMFTYGLCAWGGAKSTLVHSEVEKIISILFDNLKNLIKSKPL
jgi:hypothetical protein